jgi:putative tricarboxylic transport membrane protein
MDPTSGQPRLTFGQPLLASGIDVVVIAVALFAVGEALWIAAHLRQSKPATIPVGVPWMGREDWKRSWKPWLRGTVIGFPFGAIPAGGAEIPTFLSYVVEKKLAKHPEEFGHGAIEGVAGPEAANNASAAGTLVPLLTLGLPTTATAAVMIAAFNQYGIHPGPLLFKTEPVLVWTLIASLFVGNALLLALNLPLAPLWARLLRIPRPYLYAGILFFATLGAYAAGMQTLNIVILLIIGAVGYAARRYGFPVLPVIVGAILGPEMERQLRRALQISAGDPSALISEPLPVVLYAAIALFLVVPPVIGLARRRRSVARASARDREDSQAR